MSSPALTTAHRVHDGPGRPGDQWRCSLWACGRRHDCKRLWSHGSRAAHLQPHTELARDSNAKGSVLHPAPSECAQRRASGVHWAACREGSSAEEPPGIGVAGGSAQALLGRAEGGSMAMTMISTQWICGSQQTSHHHRIKGTLLQAVVVAPALLSMKVSAAVGIGSGVRLKGPPHLLLAAGCLLPTALASSACAQSAF